MMYVPSVLLLFTCICMYTDMHVCVEARGHPQVSASRKTLTAFENRVSHWLTHEPHRIFLYLLSPQHWTYNLVIPHQTVFTWVLAIKIRPSSFQGKNFAGWIISLTPFKGLLFIHKEEWNSVIYSKMDGSTACHVKWNKSDLVGKVMFFSLGINDQLKVEGRLLGTGRRVCPGILFGCLLATN